VAKLSAPTLQDLDAVVVMSVLPGRGGQALMPRPSLPGMQKARHELERSVSRADVEIGGGISTANARRVPDAGANVLVAASAIFQASDIAGVAGTVADLTSVDDERDGARGEEVGHAGDDPGRR
jgi:pentose-5-phosphate-3-epimerase